MALHHATKAKAESLGLLIEETEDGFECYGLLHEKAPTVLAAAILARTLGTEYPALSLAIEDDRFLVVHTAGEEEAVVSDTDKVPDLATVLEECQKLGLDPEIAEDEEEPEAAGSAVKDKYKKEYAARGNANHCGDWLAKILEGRYTSGKGKNKQFHAEAFTTFLVLNEVPMVGKWASLPTSGQKGWVGRYRMNGRQKLEVVLATRGTIRFEDGSEIKCDADWLDEQLDKHPNINPQWT